jgi:cobalt-zinc-cadmium efflux system protein
MNVMPHTHSAKKAITQKHEKQLFLSFLLNAVLAFAQFCGGVMSGSLALIADGLQNANDAITLVLAWWAKRYGRLAPDHNHSYGHQRIETIAAFGNLISLGLFAVFIIEDAIQRLFTTPAPVDSITVIALSVVAIIVNIATASMLYSGSKNSMNMRAAFFHNMTDAMSSLAILVSGIILLFHPWYWLDTVLSLLIASLMAYGMLREIKRVINLLMDAVPENIQPMQVQEAILKIKGVERVVDFHIRRLNEDINAVEAHIIVDGDILPVQVKKDVKLMLFQQFSVHHVTLETSTRDEYTLLKTVPHRHTLLERDGAILQ